MKREGRNAAIDYFRFIAMLMIVVGHYNNWCGHVYHFDFAYIIVEFFPLVAGWLFMATVLKTDFEKESLLDYAKKRFFRLFPYTFIALIPLLVYQAFHCAEPLIKQWMLAMPEMFLISYNGMNVLWGTINGPSWFVIAIFLAEIFLFAICSTCRQKTVVNFILPISVLWGYGYLAAGAVEGGQDAWSGWFNIGFFRAYIAVCLGALLYFVSQKIKKINWTAVGIGFLSVLELSMYIICVVLVLTCKSYEYTDASLRYSITAFLAVGITLTFSGITVTRKVRDGKLSRYLGKASLSLCLVHSLMIQLFYDIYESPWEHTALFMSVTVLWSFAFQSIVEAVVCLIKRGCASLKNALICDVKTGRQADR